MNRPSEAGAPSAAASAAASRAGTPRATMRLQLHGDFDFDAAAAQVPYLAALGISHLYASPILQARAGSRHGYDVVDPTRVNAELGGEEALRRLVAVLRAHRMGLIVDIVPNHLAVGKDDNPWWQDVLEWGRDSVYAGFFDIDWDVPDPALGGRVLAPFLGRPYGEALAAGEVELRFEAASGDLAFHVGGAHRFPLAPNLYAPLLRAHGERLADSARHFHETLGRAPRAARRAAFAASRRGLAERAREDGVAVAFDALLQAHRADRPGGIERLHRLLERQHYRLAWWRTAPDEINWRRFFDITDLAGLRVQDAAVFEAVHATVFRLYREGLIDGLRVDHVDGLADPRAYCRALRRRLESLRPQRPTGLNLQRAYIVVEKILASGETLARDWRVDGTSGYEFMNQVGAVLHQGAGHPALAELWRCLSGQSASFERAEQDARRRIPQQLFPADFNACTHALHQVARRELDTRDWTLGAIRRVLAELLVHFSVYRTYADARGRSDADAAVMSRAVAGARAGCRPGEAPLLLLLDRWLGGEPPQTLRNPAARRDRLRALARFQQLTSPVAAKAVEDTAFYRHGVLISRNEVGASPAQFALTAAGFHAACVDRQQHYRAAMLATATHDHKRGEDLRARLAVLSEVPAQWAEAVKRWRALNLRLKSEAGARPGPDATDEYVLYQMLVGAWPLELATGDRAGLEHLCARLRQWQRKAVREAKRRSGWVEPDLVYEEACDRFLQQLLDPECSAAFLSALREFVERIAVPGALNGLAQTLLRVTTPGVPDTYQGTEYWDFSLVDPDNRGDVDFSARAHSLHEPVSDGDLIARWRDGRVKQHLLARVLALRREVPELFERGSYVPLRTRGAREQQVLAFIREHAGRVLMVAVPLHTAGLCPPAQASAALHLPTGIWQDTRIELPARHARRRWRDVLARRDAGGGRTLDVETLFRSWPVALLVDDSCLATPASPPRQGKLSAESSVVNGRRLPSQSRVGTAR